MLTIDELEIAGPGTGAHPTDGRSSFRRILVPVGSPGESGQALAVAVRICALTGGVLRLVHVRTCDPSLRSPARFYRETPAQAAAVLEEALLTAWALRRPVGHDCRRGCPAHGRGPGHRVAGVRVARGPDRAGPPSPAGHRPPDPGQRARSGHAQSQLPGTRRSSCAQATTATARAARPSGCLPPRAALILGLPASVSSPLLVVPLRLISRSPASLAHGGFSRHGNRSACRSSAGCQGGAVRARSRCGGRRWPPAPEPGLSFGLIHPRPQPFTGVRGRLSGLVTDAGGRW